MEDKTSEELYSQSELLFEMFEKSTEEFLFLWDIVRMKFRISASIYDEFDLSDRVSVDVIEEWPKIMYPLDVDKWKHDINDILHDKKDSHDMEYRLLNKKQEIVWVSCRGQCSRDKQGNPLIMAGRITNISKLGKFDEVTGVRSRTGFYGDIKAKLETEQYHRGAIVVLDLDNFKQINETLSHAFGDKVLRRFAETVCNYLPSDIELYRMDGDEFAFFYPEATKDEIIKSFDEFILSTNTMHEIDGNTYHISLSAGVSMYPDDAVTVETLLAYASSALATAKIQGKKQIVFFSQNMHNKRIESIEMQEELIACIERDFDEFELYYQPQMDNESSRLKGAEALMRWHSSRYGEVSPIVFIPLLEENQMIIPVGKWIIREAAKKYSEWQNVIPNFKMSVNLSYVQLKDDTLMSYLKETLDKYQIKSENFLLELTENCFIPDLKLLNHNFKDLQDMGFRIAIDDFGTGYSTLNYLKELPVNVIKIDRSFIRNIQKDNYEYTFLECMIRIAHLLHLIVCVEGVETQEELRIVSSLHPDLIQGFYYSKPVCSDEFTKQFIKEEIHNGGC